MRIISEHKLEFCDYSKKRLFCKLTAITALTLSFLLFAQWLSGMLYSVFPSAKRDAFDGTLLTTIIGISGTMAGFIFAGISILSTTLSTRYGRFLTTKSVYPKSFLGMFEVVCLMLMTAMISLVGILVGSQVFDFLGVGVFVYSASLFLFNLIKLLNIILAILAEEREAVIKKIKEEKNNLGVQHCDEKSVRSV